MLIKSYMDFVIWQKHDSYKHVCLVYVIYRLSACNVKLSAHSCLNECTVSVEKKCNSHAVFVRNKSALDKQRKYVELKLWHRVLVCCK